MSLFKLAARRHRMLLLRVAASAIFLFAAGQSQATTVFSGGLIDPEFQTLWSLTIDDFGDLDPTTYSAELTAFTDNNVNSAGFFTHVVMLHLDGGETADIITFTAPDTNWNELDANSVPLQVDVEGYGNELFPMPGGWTGFYTDEVSPTLDDPTVDPTELMAGVALDGSTYTWAFDFTQIAPLNQQPSLQALSYDGLNGGSGNIARRRLSETFIPEPSGALLFGLGAWVVSRRKPRR